MVVLHLFTRPFSRLMSGPVFSKYLPGVLAYLRPHKRLAAISIGLMVLISLVGLLVPWPYKFLVDHVMENRPIPPWLASILGPLAQRPYVLVILVAITSFLITVLHYALDVLDNYVNTKIDQNMVLDFRSDLFQHAERLSLTFHDQRRTGMLIYAINFQADAAARLVMTIPQLARSFLTLVGMLVVWFLKDWTLALVSLAVIPFLYYSVGYYVTHIQKRLTEVKMLEGESLSIIHEAMSMLRVIVAFGREDHEFRRFRQQGERTIDARIKLTVRQTLFSLAVNTITATGTALVLALGAFHVLEGKLKPGDLVVILWYLAMVYKPLETISATVGSLQDVFVAMRVAFGLFETEPEVRDLPDAVELHQARGEVEFENVFFHYRGRVGTLKNISFKADAGAIIAIVGPTGAGKTTLVSLIPRFYESKQGRILLDGRDIRQIKLKSLRDQVSIVLQEPLLFSGTIEQNIRYGRLDAAPAEIIEAAKAANAHDFIMKLPKQYETELGERGAKLSGGERQRIAVARAFLRDAPILILDEPTSSIDSKTEAVILDALDRLMVGRTTFLIAHRLSTIRRADRVLVIDQGRLVEQGTQEELLKKGGLYRQLHDMQSRQRERRSDGQRTTAVPHENP
jgi:ATP-binding cassette subfamily B protein/subfamily B ATP-binding cassette protein MsbA